MKVRITQKELNRVLGEPHFCITLPETIELEAEPVEEENKCSGKFTDARDCPRHKHVIISSQDLPVEGLPKEVNNDWESFNADLVYQNGMTINQIIHYLKTHKWRIEEK